MNERLNVGDPGFGTESPPPAKPPKPLRKQPDWNEYLDPKRWEKQLGDKTKPSEFNKKPRKGS